MSMINLGKIKFSWKGVWTPTTAYTKDDVVKYGASSYVCITAHTSGANWAANAAKFEEMTQGVDWSISSYNSGTTYPANTVVLYDDALYISLQDTTGNVPFNNLTYWDTLSVFRSEGNVWHVGTNGNDDAVGTNPSTAFLTIKHALTQAQSGDTIKIGPGTFEEEFPLTVPQGVAVVGTGIRSTKIVPTALTNDKDAFLLNGETGISDLTIADMFYNAIDDTGYAFKFANNTTIALRSPYMERVTVLNRGSVTSSADPYGFQEGDAGRGALVDGAKVTRASLEAAMLFNECTFIVPNSRALIMTNGGRSEWLTCFTYFADLAVEGKVGAQGRGGDGKTLIEFGTVSGAGFQVGETIRITSTDASSVFNLVVDSKVGDTIYIDGKVDILEGEDFTPGSGGSIVGLTSGTTATSITRYDRGEFAAELRAISGANIYGNQGVKADGDDVVLQLMAWNFAYIGTGADLTNDDTAVVQANEVIEVNGGRVFYNSVDQAGNYKIGDLFSVDFATGNVTFQAPAFDVSSLTGINFTDGSNTTIVNPTQVSTGNLILSGNTISTSTGNIVMDPSGSATVSINADTNITGNLGVTGDVTIGGNITIGNQTLDSVTVVADFTSNLIPDASNTYDLGSSGKSWRNLYTGSVISTGTGSFTLPVGNVSQRPTPVTGMVRYNSELSTFEGYAASAWGSLGGVKSVDGLTYIVPETSPGASNGQLEFYAEDAAGTGSVKVTGMTRTAVSIPLTTASTTSTDGALIVSGGVGIAGTVNIGTNLNVTGDTTLSGDLQVQGGDLTTNQTTFNLLNTTASTVNFAGAGTAVNIGATTGATSIRNDLQVTGDVQVQGGDLTTNQTTFNLLNATATTVNVAGAATALNIGNATGATVTLRPGTLVGANTTQNVYNTVATTVNAFGAGTAVNIGAATGTTNIKNNLLVDGTSTFTGNVTQSGNLTVTGNLTVNGTTTSINSNTVTVDDKNIELASVAAVNGITGTITSTALTTTITGLSTVAGLIPGQAVTRTAGTGAFGTGAVITSIDSATQITVTATTNNTLGTITFNAGGATNITANGGGITVLGATNKTIQYDNANTAWTLSENLNLASAKTIKFNGTDIITPDVVTPANFVLGTALSTVTVADEILVTNNLITNGDVISDQVTQNLYPDVVSTINFGAVATTVNIGASTGTTTIKNNTDINGIVRVAGNSISSKPTTTVIASGIIGNFTNAAQSGLTTTTDGMNAEFEIEFEFDTGNIVRVTLINGGKGWRAGTIPLTGPADLLYIKGTALGGVDGGAVGTVPPTGNDIIISVLGVNTLSVLDGAGVPLDGTGVITSFAYNGSAPIISGGTTTFNLINQYVETVNFASDATTITMGAVNTLSQPDGTTTIRNNVQINGDTIVSAVSTGAPGVLRSNTPQMDVFNTVSSIVNFAGAADTVNIGSVFGVTTINNTLEVPTGIIADIKGSVFGDFSSKIIDGITGDVTANDLQVNGSATFAFDVLVQGGDIVTDQTTFNLINDTATTLNVGGAATSLTLGATTGTLTLRNATVQVDGDLNVSGGDITTGASVFNFVNSGALELYMGGSAQTVGIGSSLGSTSINNDLIAGQTLQVNGDTLNTISTTFNLINDTALTVNAFGAATVINIGEVTGTTTISSAITDLSGDLKVQGGDIISDQTSFRLLQTPTTINFADAATTLQVGAGSGTTTVRNNLDVDLDLNVDGGDITTSQTTFNLLNSTVTTLNLAGAGTQVNIGSTNGATNVKNDLNVDGKITVGSGLGSTSTIESADTTFYLANTTAENLYMGGAATVVEIGSTTGTTSVNNALAVDGQATFEQDILVKGGDITTNLTTFNLINTVASTVNLGGAATAVNIGSASGTTTVKNSLKVDGDVEVVGGDLTTNQASFNLINTNATTVNFAGGANSVNVAAPGSETNIAGNLNITGLTTVSNHIIPAANVTYDLGSSTNRFRDLYLSGGTIDLAGGTISYDGTSFNFQGGTNVGQSVETESTTFDLLNNIAQTINFGGDATTINMGAFTGSTNVRNNLAVAGQITVGSSDSSVSTLAVTDTTFFLANTTAETIFFGGAATGIQIGADNGLTTFNTDVTVDGSLAIVNDVVINGNLTLTALNTSGENNDFVISPQGTGRVIIQPQGGLVISPDTLGSLDNTAIGETVRASAKVTTLAANEQVTFNAGIPSTDTTTGTVVVTGGAAISENLQVGGNISANALTLRGTVLFDNELAVTSGGTGSGQFTTKGILYGNSTDPVQSTLASDVANPYTGTNQQTSNAILTTSADGTPVWTDVIDCGTF
jgi:hypothetical protein